MADPTWNGEERRKETHLTEAQLDAIAEKAASKAVSKMQAKAYETIGKTFVERIYITIGFAIFCVVMYAKGINPFAGK